MKRMNVREFRKNVSNLGDEPIEVVRYSETIGFWTPIALTMEPTKTAKKPLIKKPMVTDIAELMKRLKTFNEEMEKLAVRTKS